MSTCYFTPRIKWNINDTLRQHRIVLNIFVDFSLFPRKIYSSYCVMLVSLWNNNRTLCCLVLYEIKCLHYKFLCCIHGRSVNQKRKKKVLNLFKLQLVGQALNKSDKNTKHSRNVVQMISHHNVG